MAIQAVDPDPCEWSEDESRYLAGKADYSEQYWRMRETIDQPAGGDSGHPGADERNALATEEELVITVAERAQRMRDSIRQPGFRLQQFTPNG